MIKLLVITLISFFYFYESKSEDYEIVIVANVGKEVITNYDIMQRLRFISYQSGMQISEDNFTQLFFQTREILIDEIIKRAVATNLNITIDDKEVEGVVTEMSIRNKLSKEAFEEKIITVIDIELFYQQIENQLLWQKYLYSTIYKDLNVSEYEINEYIQSSANNKFYKYDIVNFFIGEDELETQKSASDYYNKMLLGEISFDMLKGQFSSSALGQVRVTADYANNIDPIILQEIKNIEIGDIAKPFKNDDRYMFLKLLDIKDESLLSRQAIKQKLLYNKFERKVKTLFENIKHQAFIERFDQIT
ncbi:MAG: hypothetical protein HOM96_03650 [Rickettsiales bacterium]|jgi:parvulin-like peptidyl-prolyl isomerase|nr:hypothetical protein [Rickettsiales bacterium]